MTKRREIGGDFNETTFGDNKIYSKGKIINNSHGDIAQNGFEGGISFNIAQIATGSQENYSLAQDLAWISMVVMYNDGTITKGKIFKRGKKAHAFKLIAKFSVDFHGFRCYHFRFTRSQNVFNAIVFVGTRSTNVWSLGDNVTQAFRASDQVGWAKQIGEKAKKLKNVIFAGHSKGGREAAQAAIVHGSAVVYSYNTSIAYLDNWWRGTTTEYIRNGGVMHHFTIPGELLMMNKANGHNAGFPPTLVYGDGVRMRTVERKRYHKYGHVIGTYKDNSICHEDGRKIGFPGEQSARHTDYNLMIKGLAKANIMNPSIDKYLSRNDVS